MSPKAKIRLDVLLHERGLYPSRARAQAAIMEGVVLVDGRKIIKAGENVAIDCEIELLEPDCPYVSRGGLKLAGALDFFSINPEGMNVLDVGASTGGFTDCLLQRKAKHVTAFDVGKGLIAWKLRNDDRVTVIENTNARTIKDDVATGPFDLIVIDVSFISLKLILPKMPARMSSDGIILSLIKPQFEAGKGRAPGGVVIDPSVWRDVLSSFTSKDIFNVENSPILCGFCVSPITGKEGNREFFGHWIMRAAICDAKQMSEWIERAIPAEMPEEQ